MMRRGWLGLLLSLQIPKKQRDLLDKTDKNCKIAFIKTLASLLCLPLMKNFYRTLSPWIRGSCYLGPYPEPMQFAKNIKKKSQSFQRA